MLSGASRVSWHGSCTEALREKGLPPAKSDLGGGAFSKGSLREVAIRDQSFGSLMELLKIRVIDSFFETSPSKSEGKRF